MGDKRSNNAGGALGDAKAIGKQARRGGSRSRGSGGGMYWTILATDQCSENIVEVFWIPTVLRG